ALRQAARLRSTTRIPRICMGPTIDRRTAATSNLRTLISRFETPRWTTGGTALSAPVARRGPAGVAAATDGPYGTGGYAVLCRPMRRRESTRLAAIGRETR